MWDVPLRMLAIGAIVTIAGKLPRFQQAFIVTVVALISVFELRQYLILFVDYPLYELVSEGLLRALHILK